MLQELIVAGNTISLYNVFDTLAGLTLFVYILFQAKKYREYLSTTTSDPKRLLTFAFLLLMIMVILLFGLLLILNRTFANWFTDGNANYYGNLTAWLIVMTLLPIIFKVSPMKTMDLLSPGLPLCLFVAKLACFFSGCCSGFEMPGSWYFNQKTERYEFPVQMIEALVALALFPFLRWYQRRNRVVGSVFPIYVIVYSVSRFVTEFLRADFPNVIGPFDAYQVMSVVYVFFGGVLLYAVCRHHQKAKILQ